MVGFSLLVLGGVFLAVTLREFRARGAEHAEFGARLLRRRQIFSLVLYAWTALMGLLLMRGIADALLMTVASTCGLLGNAVGTSWDLLVRVARIRRGEVERKPTGD